MGTPEFAVPSLENLINHKYEVVAIFTKPDRPVGRKQQIVFSPIKQLAINNNIPVFQPQSLKEATVISKIKSLNPDFIVVVAYGKILPKDVLDIPKHGCINVHGSLLPKYRGAAPIQWSIINGERQSGVTTMLMDEGLDTGDILYSRTVNIDDNQNFGELYKELSKIGAKLLIYTLEQIQNNNIVRIKQDDNLASYCSIIDKSLGKIDWHKNSYQIRNLIRGLNPMPTAYTFLDGKRLKIYNAKISHTTQESPGKIIDFEKFIVACGENTSLEILDLQMEGKKRMSTLDFVRGYKFKSTTILGSI